MNISDELKKRIRNAEVLGKVCTAKEAASFIKPDMTLGVSGFGLSGYTKVVAKELAARAEAGERLNLTVYSGASTGDDFDGVLTRAGALSCRMPYQSNKDLRMAIAYRTMRMKGLILRQTSLVLTAGSVTTCV